MTIRSFVYTASVMVLAALAPLSANGEFEADSAPRTKKAVKAGPSPVIAAMKKVKKIKNRVNEKADYFVFLYSASWCGPCCKEMPEIVKLYKEMKRSGKVDIILFSHDKTPKEAADFVKRFKIRFLTVMSSDKNAPKVPGFSAPGGIPHCCIVDRNGKVITQGHPQNVLENWKDVTINNDATNEN